MKSYPPIQRVISTIRACLFLICFILPLLSKCQCASIAPSTTTASDRALRDAPKKHTILDLCTNVHGYLAVHFWNAINQNPSLIDANGGDSGPLVRRGYNFRLFFRGDLSLGNTKRDLPKDIKRYVDNIIWDIKLARNSKDRELPEEFLRFVPTDQVNILRKVFNSNEMSREVLDSYSQYLKDMVDYRMKLVSEIGLPQKDIHRKGRTFYESVFDWATTLPNEKFFDFMESTFGVSLNTREEKKRYNYEIDQRAKYAKFLGMDPEELKHWVHTPSETEQDTSSERETTQLDGAWDREDATPFTGERYFDELNAKDLHFSVASQALISKIEEIGRQSTAVEGLKMLEAGRPYSGSFSDSSQPSYETGEIRGDGEYAKSAPDPYESPLSDSTPI
eukprot:Nk52_evm30s2568 gene=Nk52_evmTU30s2568